MTTTVAIPVPAYITNQGYKDWWCPCGINPADVVAAYAAKGAASYAASKINLANPGTFDWLDGVAFPSWNNTNGWMFSRISSQYLYINSITLNQNTTSIVKFSNHIEVAGYDQSLYGRWGDIAPHGINLSDSEGSANYFDFTTATSVVPNDPLTSGILAINKDRIYLDGNPYANWSTTPQDREGNNPIGMGASYVNVYANFLDGYIQAFAIYNKILTQSQIQEVGANMP